MNRKSYVKRLLRSMLMVVFGFIGFASYGQYQTDTIRAKNMLQQQINQDSIEARRKFVLDSIQAREKFVRDSLLRRKQILDSVTFLQGELQPLLEAIYRTTSEDIIAHADKIAIIGDSALGDYVYHKLPLGFTGPYTPWKGSLSLNAKRISFTVDKKARKINTIQSPILVCHLSYADQGLLLIIQESNIIQKGSSESFYKTPVDSVFYDRYKRIVKIKRYMHFNKLTPNYRKGDFLFTSLLQVKQYQYGTGNQITQFELDKFCERSSAYDAKKVCSITNYSVTKQGNNYVITRRNNPANAYSDGTFTMEFDERENIKCISFSDLSNKLVWQRFVEVNKDGNVSCYVDKADGVKSNTLCMVYHNEPNAKYPVETISTSYEKDGVDYFQKNLTTEKSRTRNRLTLEWGPWK